MSKITVAFKKLLGNGRAWRTPLGFTSEFLELLAYPLEKIKKRLSALRFTHFQETYVDENNIINDEELFGITEKADTLEERASEIALSWNLLSGNAHYKTLEYFLRKAGFEIEVIENTDEDISLGHGTNYGTGAYNGYIEDKKMQYGGHDSKVIGNGFLNIEGTVREPAQFKNGRNAFYIRGYFDPTDVQWDKILDIVLKVKQAHTVAVCQIAERKVADNDWYYQEQYAQMIDGGHPDTTYFIERLNPN